MTDVEPELRIISLGAGVQSTTLYLMAAAGEIEPMPNGAIFADTGWEPRAVYRHLQWLQSLALPIPIHIVTIGNLRDDLIARGNVRTKKKRFVTVPFFLLRPDGSVGMGRRQCTSHYKVEPIRRKVRELLGKGPRERIRPGACEKWLGISVDEIIRATSSKIRFEVNRFPLLEKAMHRRDCIAWLARRGYPTPPKSSCIGCPFHDDRYWRTMRDERPDEWQDAVELDRLIRTPVDTLGVPRLRQQQFMHRSLKPLDQVDLSTQADHGQLDLFGHECEGLCGV